MNPIPEIEVKRNALLMQSKAYEDKIALEVDSIKGKAIDIGKYALVTGGIAVLGFLLAKFIYNVVVSEEDAAAEDSSTKVIHLPAESNSSILPVIKEQKEQPLIVKLIMSAIATFILSIAKQKLIQFIEQLYAKEADNNSQPST